MSDRTDTASTTTRATLGRLGGVYAALHAGHAVGDHWVQRTHQALTKGRPDGQRACAAHVATLTATQAAALGLAVLATGERLSWRRVAAGLAVNAATHYWADRRTTLRGLAELTGNSELWEVGEGLGGGAYALDQSFHTGMLLLASAIIAGRP